MNIDFEWINTITLLLVCVLFGTAVLLFVNSRYHKWLGLNRKKYQNSWKTIEGSLDKSNMVTYQMAVLSADKLVDQAMKDLKVPGETMGERLKAGKSRFDNIDDVWFAHKLRNRIAHESDVSMSLHTARKALNIFEKALKDLGAI